MHKDNRGLSLVELIVVIAIMAVMMGAVGISFSMLSGAEAKQAALKMDAELNDIKTGAMSRAGEEMTIKYYDTVDEDDGVPKEGFYAVKTISTIRKSDAIDTVVTKADGTPDTEKERIASSKVKITATIGGTDKVIKSPNYSGESAIIISFDRATGKLNKVKDEAGTELGDLEKLTFECGLKTIEMTFESETGKHVIN